jgi:hypothetical protein
MRSRGQVSHNNVGFRCFHVMLSCGFPEKEAVFEDYKLQLTVGASYCYRALEAATAVLNNATSSSPNVEDGQQTQFHSMLASPHSADNVLTLDTDCTSNTSVVVSVYNSLAWQRSEFVFLATNCSNVASVTVAGKVCRRKSLHWMFSPSLTSQHGLCSLSLHNWIQLSLACSPWATRTSSV